MQSELTALQGVIHELKQEFEQIRILKSNKYVITVA